MATCPFCGGPETDRIDLEGHRFLVFRCQFTPEVDPTLDEAGIERFLSSAFAPGGTGYFRGMCDSLHRYVTKGEGARELTAERPSSD